MTHDSSQLHIQRHTDPPGLWRNLIAGSVVLHLLVLWLLRGSVIGLLAQQPSQAAVPAPILLEPQRPSRTTAKRSQPRPTSRPNRVDVPRGDAPDNAIALGTPQPRPAAVKPQIRRAKPPLPPRQVPQQPGQPSVPPQATRRFPAPVPSVPPFPAETETPTDTPPRRIPSRIVPNPVPTTTPTPTPFTPESPEPPVSETISPETPTPTPTPTNTPESIPPEAPPSRPGEEATKPDVITKDPKELENPNLPDPNPDRSPQDPPPSDNPLIPPTPSPTEIPNPGGGLVATLQLLTAEEQKSVNSIDIPDSFATPTTTTTSIPVPAELSLKPGNFKINLVIDDQGKFQSAHAIDPAIPATDKSKYEQLAQQFFQNQTFTPAGSTVNGEFKPVYSNLAILLMIEPTSSKSQ